MKFNVNVPLQITYNLPHRKKDVLCIHVLIFFLRISMFLYDLPQFIDYIFLIPDKCPFCRNSIKFAHSRSALDCVLKGPSCNFSHLKPIETYLNQFSYSITI